VFRRLQRGKGGVLLKLETGAYHSLNETGALLWELMADGLTLDDVASKFRALLDDQPSEVEAEIHDFFDQLRRRGLVDIDVDQDSGPSGP
jgi:hypothetical protein